MKGIVHFIAGIAAATFVPKAADMAASGNSFVFLLGGLFGLLPDTLDFKFYHFFYRRDRNVDPDPASLDPKQIAQQVADCANDALKTGKEVRLQLHTIPLSADTWRRYTVAFDVEQSAVEVEIGPVITTSQVPFWGSAPKENNYGRAKVNGRMLYTYDRSTAVDILRGPSFSFLPVGKDQVEIAFLPWHRSWSHSVTLSLFCGAVMWLLLGMAYGLATGLAMLAHVLLDSLGFMGSNLFWPITKKRTLGLRMTRSASAMPNFVSVHASLVIILFNLNRMSATPVFHAPWYEFFLWSFALPLAVLLVLAEVFKRYEPPAPKEPAVLRQLEIQDEQTEMFG
ncbi:MAG: metal-dependent hydrolase [Planctomycetota bacterium]|nr:metal-dependent hydrolase [Planctomycetota bacterium]